MCESSPRTIPKQPHTERSLGWRAHLFRVLTRGDLRTASKQSCMPSRFCFAYALASGQLFTSLRGAAYASCSCLASMPHMYTGHMPLATPESWVFQSKACPMAGEVLV